MTEFTISHSKLKDFLGSFGKDLADLVIEAKSDGIHASVGKDTHFIRRKVECDVSQSGKVNVSDLAKVKAFMGTMKSGDLKITQSGKASTLHIVGPSSSLQLPTSSYIQSQDKVGLMSRLIREAEESMWRKWAGFPLKYHAKVTADSLKPASKFSKVVGSKFSCKTEFDPQGAELVIRGGSSSKGKMFVRAPLIDIDSPDISARSAFDYWLPELLENLPSGELDIHTGDESVIVLKQVSTDFLMVVIDQEYEED
jgi:hypothetical protein